ncbi:hypothetical protein IWW52_003005, partial [Coemansia sp. RSA 2704]
MRGLKLARTVVVKHRAEAIRSMHESLSLLDHMRQFGAVTSFKFMRDPVTSERTGMAFVSYLHYSDAQTALSSRTHTVAGLPRPFDVVDVS